MNDIERAVEAMERIASLNHTLDAPMGDDARLDLACDTAREVLERLRRYEVVEGCHDSRIDEFRRHVAGRDHERPALLLVRAPETEEK
jgi:hypothetical protein